MYFDTLTLFLCTLQRAYFFAAFEGEIDVTFNGAFWVLSSSHACPLNTVSLSSSGCSSTTVHMNCHDTFPLFHMPKKGKRKLFYESGMHAIVTPVKGDVKWPLMFDFSFLTFFGQKIQTTRATRLWLNCLSWVDETFTLVIGDGHEATRGKRRQNG